MCQWIDTGWRRLIGSPKLQIIFHKRATKYRALLRKMTYKDKGSYESSPPCNKPWSVVSTTRSVVKCVDMHVHVQVNRRQKQLSSVFTCTYICQWNINKNCCLVCWHARQQERLCVDIYICTCVSAFKTRRARSVVSTTRSVVKCVDMYVHVQVNRQQKQLCCVFICSCMCQWNDNKDCCLLCWHVRQQERLCVDMYVHV